jgi:hypothetical protein
MTLPVRQLARDTVQVNGQSVAIRSLSRKETIEMTRFKDDVDGGEIFIIARATDSSEDEVRIFRETTNGLEVDNLINAILKLSGLDQLQARAKAQAEANGSPNA